MGPVTTWTTALAGGLELWVLGALKATVLLGVTGLIVAAMRNASAAARHLVWSLGLLAALVVPLASGVLPAWPVAWWPAASWSVVTEPRHDAAPSTEFGAADVEHRATASRATASSDASTNASTASDPILPSASAGAASPSRNAPRLAAILTTLLRVAPYAWLAGILLLVTRRIVASRRLSRLAGGADRVSDARWLSLLAECAARMGVRRAVTLRIGGEAQVPMTWGTRRPVILVPRDASEWSAERRAIVLLHELAHIRRFDTLTISLAQVCCALHWFNPIVWAAAKGLRNEAERACDDLVLAAGTRASAYAQDLLDIARGASRDEPLASAALAMARRSQLEGRLLDILDPRRARGAMGRVPLACAVLLATAATTVFGAIRPVEWHRWSNPVAVPAPASAPIATVAPPTRATAPITPVAIAPEAPEPPEPAAPSVPAVSAAPAVASTPAVPATPAARTGSHQSSWSINDSDGAKSWKGGWVNEQGSAKGRAKGDITFNRDGTDIERISDNGFFEFEIQRDGHTRRVEIRSRGGRLERTFSVDGRAHPWDAEAQTWFAGALIDLDRGTGLLVDQRVPALLAMGGAAAVLADIEKMTSDYVKALYFDRLLDTRLDRAAMSRVITSAGQQIDSDYELAKTLSKAVDKNALADVGNHAAFLAAADRLESDYERARVLMMVVERNNASPAALNTALRSATHLSSDYERSRVLTAVASRTQLDAAGQQLYIESAAQLESDYERGRSLSALLEHQQVEASSAIRLLQAAGSMTSDYERANLLVLVVEHVRLDGAGLEAYRKAARGIGSEYDRNRAMAALADRGGY